VTAALELGGARVAVLGWAGSTPRQLRGVARFYRQRGGDPFTHCARVVRAMARPDGWALEGREVAARLAGDAPIVVHLFSNAGFWTWAAALEARPALGARVRAVVLDSAPGFPSSIRPSFYARYSAMAMMPMVLRALKRPPALRHPLLTPPVRAFMRLWFHVSVDQRRFAERSLDTVAAVGPHLLLYSAADELVPVHLVDAFFERLAGAERRRFESGAHVKLMLEHRRTYFDAVEAFLERALAS
jgi:pimeloyl-ACP methyl ester carboxylesterase